MAVKFPKSISRSNIEGVFDKFLPEIFLGGKVIQIINCGNQIGKLGNNLWQKQVALVYKSHENMNMWGTSQFLNIIPRRAKYKKQIIVMST